MSAPHIGDLIEVAVVIAILGLGLWIAGIAFYRHDKGRARIVLAWPTTQGEVLWCGIKSTYYDLDFGAVKFFGINFVYTVGGRRINGSSLINKTLLEQYRKGTSILVHYNPDNPSENRVIEITKNTGPFTIMILCAAVAITVILIFLMSEVLLLTR